MSSPENPYKSPQTAQLQSSTLRHPPNTTADQSIFNLDAAALGLMIVSSVEALMLLQFAAAAFLANPTSPIAGAPLVRNNATLIVVIALTLRPAAVMAIAYFCMSKRRFYGLALLGAILPLAGILSWPICFSIPFGIWALIRLLRKDTRAAFTEASHPS